MRLNAKHSQSPCPNYKWQQTEVVDGRKGESLLSIHNSRTSSHKGKTAECSMDKEMKFKDICINSKILDDEKTIYTRARFTLTSRIYAKPRNSLTSQTSNPVKKDRKL